MTFQGRLKQVDESIRVTDAWMHVLWVASFVGGKFQIITKTKKESPKQGNNSPKVINHMPQQKSLLVIIKGNSQLTERILNDNYPSQYSPTVIIINRP